MNYIRKIFQSKAKEIDANNKSTHFWKTRNDENWNFQRFFPERHQKQIQFIESHQQIFNSANKILDLRCASGEFSIYLSQKYPQISINAFDISSGFITKAKEAAANHQVNNVSFSIASLEQWIKNDTNIVYDHILVMGLFTCILPAKLFHQAIETISKRINKDGILVLKDTLSESNKDRIHNEEHYCAIYRSKNQYIEAFRALGFQMLCSKAISDNDNGIVSYMFSLQK